MRLPLLRLLLLREQPAGPLTANYGLAELELLIKHYAPKDMDRALHLINENKSRDQYPLYKGAWLEKHRESSYREIAVPRHNRARRPSTTRSSSFSTSSLSCLSQTQFPRVGSRCRTA